MLAAGTRCRQRLRHFSIGIDVGIDQAADHALVMRVIFCRLGLEEFHAFLAQCNSYLDSVIAERKLLGSMSWMTLASIGSSV